MTRMHLRLAVLAVIVAASVAASAVPAGGASASTVVAATVPSATNISTLGCQTGTTGTTYLGTVLPGSTAIGAGTCDVTFGSSNDTSMLRMSQSDGRGDAMHSLPHDIDTSFGGDGTVELDVSPADDDEPIGILAEPGTDKVLLFGWAVFADVDIYVARLNADGTPDTTFDGGDGIKVIDLGANEKPSTVLFDPDGAGYILAGGTGSTPDADDDVLVVKLDAAGDLDTGFDGSGFRVIDSGSCCESILHLQPRTAGPGWIGVATRLVGAASHASIVRLTDDFSFDATFAGDGYVDLPGVGGESSCGRPVERADGSIFCAGTEWVSATRSDALVAHILADGTPDPAFAGDGFAELPFGVLDDVDHAASIDVRPNGTLVVIGMADESSTPYSFLAHVTPAGALDTSFSGDGWVSVAAPGYDTTYLTGTSEAAPDASGGYVVSGAVLELAPSPSLYGMLGMLDASGNWVPGVFGTQGFAIIDTASSPNTWEQSTGSTVGVDGSWLISAFSTQGDDVSGAVRISSTTIPDYAFGGSDWTNGTGAFGACLTGVSNATEDWGIGTCDGTDAATWQGIPDAVSTPTSKVAHAASTQTSAAAHLRFGVRVPSNLPPDLYVAHIDFTVLAPEAP